MYAAGLPHNCFSVVADICQSFDQCVPVVAEGCQNRLGKLSIFAKGLLLVSTRLPVKSCKIQSDISLPQKYI